MRAATKVILRRVIRWNTSRNIFGLGAPSLFVALISIQDIGRSKLEESATNESIITAYNHVSNKRRIERLIWDPLMSMIEKLRRWVKSFRKGFLVFVRGLEVCILALPLGVFILVLPLDNFLWRDHRIFESIMWKYILTYLQILGPFFVKLGQWGSTRRDLFSSHICDNLSPLQSKAFIHSWSHTHRQLLHAFGPQYTETLHIGPESPIIGSGAIAQVYKANLSGHDVAVKVLHPNISPKITRDIRLINSVAWLLQSILPEDISRCFNIRKAAENFALLLERQIDLSDEAKNLLQFQYNFQNNRVYTDCTIDFPNPIPGWVSKHILVEDLVSDSKHISAYLDSSDLNEKSILAATLVHAFFKMLFLDNFFHSDLHPGNILVTQEKSDYKITFLDAGLAFSLQPNDLKNLKDLFMSVVLNDGEMAGNLMISRFRGNASVQPRDVNGFKLGLQKIVSQFHSSLNNHLTLGTVQVGTLLGQVLDLCRVHCVELDPNMTNVAISVVVLEGLGRSLDPNLDLMKLAVPFLLTAGDSE